MPKVTKCLKCLKLMYSVDFIILETPGRLLISFLFFGFVQAKIRSFIKKKERSDTIILGILAQFRHFPDFPC